MTTVPVYEAKTRLSELLAQAGRGEEITITRHGVPVARLVAPGPEGKPSSGDDPGARRRRQVEAAITALMELRQGVTLDLTLRDAIAAGRD